MLKNNESCVLTKIEDNKATIILPEIGEGESEVNLDELAKIYSGFAFLLKPLHHYKDARKRVLKHESNHWFWDTLKFSLTIYFDVIVASFLINLFVLNKSAFYYECV